MVLAYGLTERGRGLLSEDGLVRRFVIEALLRTDCSRMDQLVRTLFREGWPLVDLEQSVASCSVNIPGLCAGLATDPDGVLGSFTAAGVPPPDQYDRSADRRVAERGDRFRRCIRWLKRIYTERRLIDGTTLAEDLAIHVRVPEDRDELQRALAPAVHGSSVDRSVLAGICGRLAVHLESSHPHNLASALAEQFRTMKAELEREQQAIAGRAARERRVLEEERQRAEREQRDIEAAAKDAMRLLGVLETLTVEFERERGIAPDDLEPLRAAVRVAQESVGSAKGKETEYLRRLSVVGKRIESIEASHKKMADAKQQEIRALEERLAALRAQCRAEEARLAEIRTGIARAVVPAKDPPVPSVPSTEAVREAPVTLSPSNFAAYQSLRALCAVLEEDYGAAFRDRVDVGVMNLFVGRIWSGSTMPGVRISALRGIGVATPIGNAVWRVPHIDAVLQDADWGGQPVLSKDDIRTVLRKAATAVIDVAKQRVGALPAPVVA